MKTALLALVAMICLTFTASAADITGTRINGTWVVDQPPPSGSRGGSMDRSTYEFKVAGGTVTGSITLRPGRAPLVIPLADGKINDDTFSFTTTQPNRGGDDIKLKYTGKAFGDTIELTIDNGQGNPLIITLKKGDYREGRR